ncbi:hypothetical protein KCU73_g5243, partial [Aureobasidium melanogenum]
MMASTAAYNPGPNKKSPQIMTNTWMMVMTLLEALLNSLPLYICQYATAKKMNPKKESNAAPRSDKKSPMLGTTSEKMKAMAQIPAMTAIQTPQPTTVLEWA